MSDYSEYIITLNDESELDQFYIDMETIGGTENVPDREVSVYKRRPLSKNTHYLLTYDEVQKLLLDPRITNIELASLVLSTITPNWTTPVEAFDKSSSNSSSYYNWGLSRCVKGDQTANWGSNGTSTLTETISTTTSGRHVDVIIIDGHINPEHPEFSVNSDGTGGSRVNQFDWHSLNSIASSIDNDATTALSGQYVYTPYTGPENNHGCHVAGTVAGNTNGWARDANIYNISPYGVSPNSNTMDALILWDYIRAFHRNKAINPLTGVKNPTICNCSYGTTLTFPSSSLGTGSITHATKRGISVGDYSTALTVTELTNAGIYNTSAIAAVPYYSTSIASDIQQAINDGIIIVAAAGNDSFLIDVSSGPDYNNTFNATYGGTSYLWYTHRGSTPGSVPGVIGVGAIDTIYTERKASFSNTGPAISLYAPGKYIMSSFNDNGTYAASTDPRNSSYYKGKISGTSMASPQVCGVLACALEIYPNMAQAAAKNYITSYAKTGQLTSTSGGTSDLYDLQNGPNKYLYHNLERYTINIIFPKTNYKFRPSTGVVYPRPKKLRYGLN
jgi:hypothetical protein